MARKLIVLSSVIALVLATAGDAEAGRRRRCRGYGGHGQGACCPVASCAAPCGQNYGTMCGPSCGAPCGPTCCAPGGGYGGDMAPMGSSYSDSANSSQPTDAPEPPPEQPQR